MEGLWAWWLNCLGHKASMMWCWNPFNDLWFRNFLNKKSRSCIFFQWISLEELIFFFLSLQLISWYWTFHCAKRLCASNYRTACESLVAVLFQWQLTSQDLLTWPVSGFLNVVVILSQRAASNCRVASWLWWWGPSIFERCQLSLTFSWIYGAMCLLLMRLLIISLIIVN